MVSSQIFESKLGIGIFGATTLGAFFEVHKHHIPGIKGASPEGANALSASRRVGETKIIKGGRDMESVSKTSVVIGIRRKPT